MAIHLLWQADVADFDAWHAVFQEDRKAQHAAGLTTLHVWKDPEQPNHALVLFAVSDRDKAKAFLKSDDLAMHLERGGVAHVQMKLLEAV
ncbi:MULTISPECIES: hypothetical protein [unclassified Meridianimarinicoccus]|uniref:hypothetical protein n=1 Tax=unclassified Meridianimarinicoccus TaxID=2923344 RepID=UPI0018670808|nr:hypothetical protein [Fluviibacterium sp. MJW13]